MAAPPKKSRAISLASMGEAVSREDILNIISVVRTEQELKTKLFEGWKRDNDMQKVPDALASMAQTIGPMPTISSENIASNDQTNPGDDEYDDGPPDPSLYANAPLPGRVNPGAQKWNCMLTFRLRTEGKIRPTNDAAYERYCKQIADLSPEYDKEQHPERVLIANHIRRPSGSSLVDIKGRPRDPYTYEFCLFPNFIHLIAHYFTRTRHDLTLFAVVEENEPVFFYLDAEILCKYLNPRVHGSSHLALFGYCLALVRSVLSLVCGVSLVAWADTYLVYDSTVANVKWSAHTHVPWPFSNIMALRAAMLQCQKILVEMDKANIACVKPLFYDQQTTTPEGVTTTERKSVVDFLVYTPNRHFRLPTCTKSEKQSYLRFANCWHRPLDTRDLTYQTVEFQLSAGAILCRNSRAFWNKQNLLTLEQHPEWLDTLRSVEWSSIHQIPTGTKAEDFRVIPISGVANEIQSWLRKLFDMSNWTANQDHQQLIRDGFKKYIQAVVAMDWDVLCADTSRGPQCQRLYRICAISPHALGTALILLSEWLTPGLPLEQQYAIKPVQRDLLLDVGTMTEKLERLRKSDPIEMFRQVFSVVLAAENYHCDVRHAVPNQTDEKIAHAKWIMHDFCKELLEETMQKSAYNRSVLGNMLFFHQLSRRLMLCGGVYVHEFRVSTDPIGFLYAHPQDMPLDQRRQAYRCAFDGCMDKGRYAGVPYTAVLEGLDLLQPPILGGTEDCPVQLLKLGALRVVNEPLP